MGRPRCQMGRPFGARARACACAQSSDDPSRPLARKQNADSTGVAKFMCRRVRWAPALVAVASLLTVLRVALFPVVAWGQGPSTALHDNTPSPVARGLAHLRGARSTNASVSLNVDLATREPVELEELIRAASTPGSPSYGHYLTPEQYDARFAPTASELSAVETWLRGLGLDVAGASPDNSLVHVDASTAAIEQAFGVNINNYTFQGREFYAN